MTNKSLVEISTEWDIVAARQLGRDEAREIGFGIVDQARISTAISELARSLFLYGIAGEIVIERITSADKLGVCVTASYSSQNEGNQIKQVRSSSSGKLDVGFESVKRLIDEIEIQEDVAKGTFVKIQKWLE